MTHAICVPGKMPNLVSLVPPESTLMKKRNFLSVIGWVFIAAFHLEAQDVIVLTSGDEVQAKVTEVLPTEVKYKKWGNLDGPMYTESKATIFMIKYENGTKEVFPPQTTSTTTSGTPEHNTDQILSVLQENIQAKVSGVQGQPLRFAGFNKTNGVMREVQGQSIYDVEFGVTVEFIRDGWLTAQGNRNAISRSNRMNRMATR